MHKHEKLKNFYDNPQKQFRRRMMKKSKPIRNSKGKIVVHAEFQNPNKEVGKIYANKKWFQETRTISKEQIDSLSQKKVVLSPFEVLLSKNKLPFNLLEEKKQKQKVKIDFQEIYGIKSQRNKPNLETLCINKKQTVLIKEEKEENYEETIIKGVSKRIWSELYKVIDCSDVIIHVLDARDPLNTKCNLIEKYLKENNKHLIFLLNKVDLVPFEVIREWQNLINKKYPCVLFHANSINNNYGKENLISILKQFKKLSSKNSISCGFVGYPNVGKSSIINAIRKKVVCTVAPIPGATKVYQYINLTKKIFLIDCPGVVPITSKERAIFQGAIRIENIKEPEYFIKTLFLEHKNALESVYQIKALDYEDFLDKFSDKYKKIMKGGLYNTEISAKIILNDFFRGKIPHFKEVSEQFYETLSK